MSLTFFFCKQKTSNSLDSTYASIFRRKNQIIIIYVITLWVSLMSNREREYNDPFISWKIVQFQPNFCLLFLVCRKLCTKRRRNWKRQTYKCCHAIHTIGQSVEICAPIQMIETMWARGTTLLPVPWSGNSQKNYHFINYYCLWLERFNRGPTLSGIISPKITNGTGRAPQEAMNSTVEKLTTGIHCTHRKSMPRLVLR